ncbi:DUF1294 domain-containing protein [Glaciibacter sp. 2TAF33]|uniref:DUF1294 domain-containing protein n=1 Tax=Glaciibacter sp. 2TAF33 TaxID=3233015 RepID=UPI003F8DB982
MGPRTERVHGTLTSWNDDRGFGFITPTQGTNRAFVHIKAFPSRATRPQVGEALTFTIEHSADGKQRAARVQVAGRRIPTKSRRRTSRGRSGAASYLTILAFVIGYLAANAMWPIPIWVAGLYLVASIACFIVYAADKSAATARRWRVPENTLILVGVVGGWPGAILAQQMLRHKTQKAAFRAVFWRSVLVNLIVFVVFATPAFSLFVEANKRPLL